MHTLVTGGGGFLGRAIVEQLLARGDQVRSFSRGVHAELTELGVEVVRGDIRDAEAVAQACEGIECVFHTAAIAGIGGTWNRFYSANTLGTENVIAACRRHGVQSLVYTSSPSVTFAGGDQCGVTECEAPIDLAWLEKNECHYSRSKALAEQGVLAANCEQLATCALRPHLIWGPGDPHLVPRLIHRAKSGRLRRVGDGTNLVDVIHVENAARAHLQAADSLVRPDSPVAGKTYFLSQGEPVNCWQWINQILALVNVPPVIKSISLKKALRIGQACEWGYRIARSQQEPPMTRFLAWQLASSHWFDISAARQDFGYQPLVSTAEGMQQLAAWLQPS
ncbi:NAD-dependent epimerase/dehydratase family protein [Bythopirellula goksoeyrii]|uniref:3 beta-hydroxysteroid dehydrogenase/Delta 5-->4-isomerase n=1 Tax=Bythopirellula goksoeyrii TaxID=1400387 RepID=A0A5B9QA99_9BACT|nr:NAD-dependent epimerase/dehydratase family protein [Bythopirellula goksoeyrii]QEG34392.1 3 beta-hydroxysteroid dehydrogenase/Delta 5-->4-isomerase [Bythopirellula goksoeyrii]